MTIGHCLHDYVLLPKSIARSAGRVTLVAMGKNESGAQNHDSASATPRARRPQAGGARVRARKPSQPMPADSPAEEKIRARAYQFYLERGGAPGDPVADWIRAESELTGRTAQTRIAE